MGLTVQQRSRAQWDLKDLARISELDFKPAPKQFKVSNFDNVLLPLVDDADIIIVAGAFFGDEGKGKTVDAILRRANVRVVARVNSGENAGHTVVFDGKKFVFHLAPSGMLIPGVQCLIGPECVMDPVNFFNRELKPLIELNIPIKLIVGNAHIVTPYHKLLDLLSNPTNSSTLQGMSPTHASKVSKKGIRLNDLFDRQTLSDKLKRDLETYKATINYQNQTEEEILAKCEMINSGMKRIPDHVLEFLKAKDQIEYMINLFTSTVVDNSAFPPMGDVGAILRDELKNKRKIMLEGPQSFWLSNGIDTHWRSSTSASVHASGILGAAQVPLHYKVMVVNVQKVPSSRVGIGSNPAGYVPQDYFSSQSKQTLLDLLGVCEDFDSIQRQYFNAVGENGVLLPDTFVDVGRGTRGVFIISEAMSIASAREHGEEGATSRKPRITGLFDCVAHNVVNEEQGPHLSISAVDRYDYYDKIGVIIAYVYHDVDGKERKSNGRTYKDRDIIRAGDPIPNEAVLEHCYPIIKILKGWKGQPISSTMRKEGDELPDGVNELLATIEHFTGAKIISIGNGPEAKDLIYLKRTSSELFLG